MTIATTKTNPQYSFFQKNDPITTDQGYLNAFGPAESPEEVNASILSDLARMRIDPKVLHGAQLLHASHSSSLQMFTSDQGHAGNLLPFAQLQAKTKAVFSGVLDEGIGARGQAQNAISTVCIKDMMTDSSLKTLWTTYMPWTPQTKTKTTRILGPKTTPIPPEIQKMRNEIELKRQDAWEKIGDTGRLLTSLGFPIVYGIKPSRAGSWKPYNREEIRLEGGALASEISVIFAPAERVELVKALIRISGHHQIAVEETPKYFT